MSGLIERRASRRHSLQMGEEEKGQEEAEGDNISHQIVRRQQRRHSMPATLNPWTTGTAAQIIMQREDQTKVAGTNVE